MATENENRNRLLSALITLLLGGGIVTTLLVTHLNYEDSPEDANKMMADKIDFGIEDEEFVEFEEEMLAKAGGNDEAEEQMVQESTSEEMTDQPSEQESGQNELENQGTVNEPPQPPVSTKNESPMKVEKKPEKVITKPQSESRVDATETKKKGENTPKTPTNTPTTTTNNNANKPNSNVAEVANAFKNNGTAPGANQNGTMVKLSIGGGLGGYTLENFPTAPCPGPGTVVVSVVVSPTGKVTKATVTGGSLSGNARACEICKRLAKQSTFRVPKNTTLERTGTLIYTVK